MNSLTNNITTILFDMDGVLISAKEWHYGALNRALVDFGYEPISRQDHINTYDGLPTRKKLAILQQTQAIPTDEFEAINTRKQNYTAEISAQLCYPTPDHVNALSRLKAEGYQLAVCSNSVRNSVVTMMTKAELMPYLSFYLSNEDVENPKPHPEIYQTAMERFGVSPTQCLILEDNINGIKAAKASGGYCMEIVDVEEVTYANIKDFIQRIGNHAN